MAAQFGSLERCFDVALQFLTSPKLQQHKSKTWTLDFEVKSKQATRGR